MLGESRVGGAGERERDRVPRASRFGGGVYSCAAAASSCYFLALASFNLSARMSRAARAASISC